MMVWLGTNLLAAADKGAECGTLRILCLAILGHVGPTMSDTYTPTLKSIGFPAVGFQRLASKQSATQTTACRHG